MAITLEHRIQTLNRASRKKRFDAYDDVPWDDPAYEIDPSDPRWELTGHDTLGATAWYRDQPPEVRSRLGLHLVLEQLRIGIDFEGVLSRGLLLYAATLDPQDPAFRYAYHEVAEEVQHTLMFREMIVRAGLPVEGLTGVNKRHSFYVPKLARSSPAQFFFHVLGGEAPIDFEQRRLLRRAAPIHPLLERIVRIHVTEEARHIAFAEMSLRAMLPTISRATRAYLSFRVPLILAVMSAEMLTPPRSLTRRYGIPGSVVREAYTDNPVFLARRRSSLQRARALCLEMGLIGPRTVWLWKLLKIWDEPATPGLPEPAVG